MTLFAQFGRWKLTAIMWVHRDVSCSQCVHRVAMPVLLLDACHEPRVPKAHCIIKTSSVILHVHVSIRSTINRSSSGRWHSEQCETSNSHSKCFVCVRSSAQLAVWNTREHLFASVASLCVSSYISALLSALRVAWTMYAPSCFGKQQLNRLVLRCITSNYRPWQLLSCQPAQQPHLVCKVHVILALVIVRVKRARVD